MFSKCYFINIYILLDWLINSLIKIKKVLKHKFDLFIVEVINMARQTRLYCHFKIYCSLFSFIGNDFHLFMQLITVVAQVLKWAPFVVAKS